MNAARASWLLCLSALLCIGSSACGSEPEIPVEEDDKMADAGLDALEDVGGDDGSRDAQTDVGDATTDVTPDTSDGSEPDPELCGNRFVDPGERCDGEMIDGAPCNSLEGSRGLLACTPDCQGIDTSGCYLPGCGDGIVNGSEACDDGNESDTDECARDCTPTAPFRDFDRDITELMDFWGIPGGIAAITRDERLVHVRGYGTSDASQLLATDPSTRFRIASLSKSITSVAIHVLVERGLLDVNERVFDVLGLIAPADMDERWRDITVLQLLQHRGGFSGTDWLFKNRDVAMALGIPGPAEPMDIVRFMLGRELGYTPGNDYSYSNFGFLLLGEVVRAKAGEPYEDFVRREVLAPMGITRMWTGRSRLARRLVGEAFYHPRESRSLSTSVFPGEGEVPHPDGGFYIESMQSLGGWVASAPDLMRFMVHIDQFDAVPDLLSSDTIDLLTAKPSGVPSGATNWYGRGFFVQADSGDRGYYHVGVLSGTRAFMIRLPEGTNIAVVFNYWPSDRDGRSFAGEMPNTIVSAAREITSWPSYDLFDVHP